MAINTYLSIIPLKVDRLKALIKRDRVADLIKKLEPTTGCLQETHFGAKDTQRLKVSGSAQGNLSCVPLTPAAAGAQEALPECFIWPLIKEAKKLVGNIFCSAQHGACPLLGRGPGPLWDHGMQLPMGDKRPPEPFVSAPPRLKAAFLALGASMPHSGNASPSPLSFPSPEISLSLSYPPKSGHRAATASLLSACETAPSGG